MPATRQFGTLPHGQPVTAYDITDGEGLQLSVLDLGATIQRFRVFSLEGDPVDVVLGYDNLSSYLADDNAYQGSIVGRYANRISGASFVLDGVTHTVKPNEGSTCLHGGPDGFHRRPWQLVEHTRTTVSFLLVSPDGDQGFPGTLTATSTYTAADGGVQLDLTAITDEPTVVNLTSHAYFNLAGGGCASIDDHLLTVHADRFLPVDSHSIPTGLTEPVGGAPFDFRAPARLADRIRDPHPQVAQAGGVDHAFKLNGEGMRHAARLHHPASGRVLDVHTNQPSLQVYTGNFLNRSTPGRNGLLMRQADGIALETQQHPDAPNQPQLGQSRLEPGELYHARTR